MKTEITSLVRTCDLQEVITHFKNYGAIVIIGKVPGHIEAPGTKQLTIQAYPRAFLMAGQKLKGYGSWGLNDNLHITCASVVKRMKRAFKNGISFDGKLFYNLSELRIAVNNLGMDFKSYKNVLMGAILKRKGFASTYPGGGQDRVYTSCKN